MAVNATQSAAHHKCLLTIVAPSVECTRTTVEITGSAACRLREADAARVAELVYKDVNRHYTFFPSRLLRDANRSVHAEVEQRLGGNRNPHEVHGILQRRRAVGQRHELRRRDWRVDRIGGFTRSGRGQSLEAAD
jgi:hypothetical protein